MPTTMSMPPSAMPFLTRPSSADETSRDAWPTSTGKAAEAIGKGLGVLARQQRGRHHHRHLLAVHHRLEGGAQRHLGLAEAHIAADQPVHRPAGREIGDGRVDRRLLVLGFLVGEARGELVHRAGRDREPRRLAELPLGRDLDQLMGDLADAVLHPRLARLPAGAAEPIELDAGLLGAVARQKLDVLHRQVELGALGVMDFQAVVRRAGRLDVLQADEPADAVIDVHHEVAGRKARHLGDEVFGALRRPPRPHQPVAEDVLLADHGGVRRLEAGLEPQHRERHLRLRQRQRLGPRAGTGQVGESVLGQHVLHALARALAPQRHDHALALRLQGHARASSPHRTRRLRSRRARPRSCGPAACRHRRWRASLPAPQTASAAPAPRCSAARPIRLPADTAGPAAAACTARRLRAVSASLRAS